MEGVNLKGHEKWTLMIRTLAPFFFFVREGIGLSFFLRRLFSPVLGETLYFNFGTC
jgi:hypothetical protein